VAARVWRGPADRPVFVSIFGFFAASLACGCGLEGGSEEFRGVFFSRAISAFNSANSAVNAAIRD